MSDIPPPLTGNEEAVMRALGRLLIVLPRILDADLQRDQRMSLNEYSVLRHLSEAPCRRMRMSDLAAACDLSLSGMSRLVAKMEATGFITREQCPRDARAFEAVLTDAGLRRLEQAWPDHLASVRRRVFDHLGDLDPVRLAAALEAMNRP